MIVQPTCCYCFIVYLLQDFDNGLWLVGAVDDGG